MDESGIDDDLPPYLSADLLYEQPDVIGGDLDDDEDDDDDEDIEKRSRYNFVQCCIPKLTLIHPGLIVEYVLWYISALQRLR